MFFYSPKFYIIIRKSGVHFWQGLCCASSETDKEKGIARSVINLRPIFTALFVPNLYTIITFRQHFEWLLNILYVYFDRVPLPKIYHFIKLLRLDRQRRATQSLIKFPSLFLIPFSIPIDNKFTTQPFNTSPNFWFAILV